VYAEAETDQLFADSSFKATAGVSGLAGKVSVAAASVSVAWPSA
jgi:hypothetical protein